MPTDSDLVPALQLKFWPDSVQPFFERIKQNRPHLHDLILSKTSMHVVPKWSAKTCIDEQDLEFRYSFSAIEILLAKHRTHNEQVLNGIARSIYYRYLNETVLPSYFIKTSVLWMCETMDLNDSQETPLLLAQKWIKYVVNKLNSGECAHYFIDNFNIFGSHTPETLEKAKHILLNEVKLDEIIETHMYTAQNQQQHFDTFNSNRKNYIYGLKVKDVLPLIHDYRTLKEDWIGLRTNIQHPNKEISEALDILCTLRMFDGEKMENWKTFRELFLNHNDSSEYAEPIWDDDVVEDEDPAEFCSVLSMIGAVLHMIQQNIDDPPNFLTQNVQKDDVDVKNYQNVFQPIPWLDLMRATRSITLDPSVSSFSRRTVIDEHPKGPNEVDNQLTHMEHFSIIDVCQIALDKDMTLGEVENYYKGYTNEEIFALARALHLMITRQLVSIGSLSSLLQVDATFKVNWNELSLLVFGSSDSNRHFHPYGVALISTDEAADSYMHVFQTLKQVVQSVTGIVFNVAYLLGDGAKGITAAQQHEFPTAKRLMCWAHTLRKCREHRKMVPSDK
ncbi:unnamed protein product [Didymodactylos carnosus]|uniref:MULE transposase domain-containing protein n=1 Tax=Didymodactylos carnosus TaxID=1234261 RepID=A0A815L8Y3_9BILA|nr:unnamed protein product [Didymodactylos carnosus]CAF4294937.1 unnamed protein product [Didymodactylos carnosus]